MKIQCACGAKYAFDVAPEQAHQPVRFVCPSCGLDSSEYVTNLVRQQYGITGGGAPSIEVAPPPQIAPAPPRVAAPAPTPSSPPPPAQVRFAASAPNPYAQPTPPAPPSQPVQARLRGSVAKLEEPDQPVADDRFCRKHPGVRTTEKCVVCQKPICPLCMQLFGYVCSPLCKQKAELQGIDVPVFAGQKDVVERQHWRKIGLAGGAIAAVIAILVGVWGWYAWYGSVPRVAFAVRFDKPAYSGQSFLCGENQIVFLRGGTLARYDLKENKEFWSAHLIDHKAIEEQVKRTIKSLQEAQHRREQEFPDSDPIDIPPPEKLTDSGERMAAAMMELRVVGKNIWVSSYGKLVQYDWETGKPTKELAMHESFRGMIPRGNELLMLNEDQGKEVVTHIDLASGTMTEETVGQSEGGTNNVRREIAQAGGATPQKTSGAGLPGVPGKDGDKALDPKKVAEQSSHLSLPQQLALPAVLSVARAQDQALAEANGTSGPKKRVIESSPEDLNRFQLIPARAGYVQFSSKLLERRMVDRVAVKPRSGKSALDGPVSVTATAEVANEILGDIQREHGGDTVTEDESRYQVTIRRADGKGNAEWSGEVVGQPGLYPLKSVNVLTANKKIIVFDKDNKKLWESALTYNVVRSALDGDEETVGQGPCVERDGKLYVFDQGVLTAFDLKTGNALWRVPSVGISGLFFDDRGMLYVNTTTASPDSIKYSRQIDVTARTGDQILKVDSRTGKQLWQRELRGELRYVSGKFIYTVESYQADEEEGGRRVQVGLATDSFVRIRRINPKNGRDLWVHFQLRSPLDVKFEKNTIQLVFKKEVQVLKFLSL